MSVEKTQPVLESEDSTTTSEKMMIDSAVISQSDTKSNNLRGELVDIEKTIEEIKTENVLCNKQTTPGGSNESANLHCYCLKERIPSTVELLCGSCCRWYHEACLSFSLGKCVPFMTNYTFLCKDCNPSGIELFNKRQSTFVQMCQTTIANLIQQSIVNGKPRAMFSKDKEIIPFIDANWEGLTSFSRRVKQTWHTTIYKAMVKDSETFIIEEKPSTLENSNDHPHFGLVMNDISKIGPNYDHKTGQFKPSEIQKLTSSSAYGSSGAVGSGKGRGAKRKPVESLMTNKKIKSELIMPKLPPHGFPLEHPFNKDGYRYILAEPDPHAPCRQEFDESLDWAGKPIPGWLYRTLAPPKVLLALHDRAPQLKISDDRLMVTGEKGYCMVRATHGVSHGCWYFECKIEDMPDNSATRIGWSQPLGNLQAPLGYDKFGYAWRSRKGTRFHESRGKHYSSGYKTGDILGFLIKLPSEDSRKIGQLPQSFKDRPLVKFKSYLYYEEKDETQKAVKNLKSLLGSRIVFYRNGKSEGVAWSDINKGTYFPAISLYKNAMVSINFGPRFIYPPNTTNFRGMHEAAHEFVIEQTISDAIFLVENDGKLRLDTYGT